MQLFWHVGLSYQLVLISMFSIKLLELLLAFEFRVRTTQEKPLGCTNNITDVDDTGRYWGFIQR
jgi:hypothetical protein